MRATIAALLVAFAAFPALASCSGDDGEDADRFAQIPKRTIEAPPNKTRAARGADRRFQRLGPGHEDG